jgi:hypothetical protein
MTAKRMNFLIDDESFEVLEAMKTKRGIPYTSTLKRALKFWGYANDQKDEGLSLQVVDSRGKVVHGIDIF